MNRKVKYNLEEKLAIVRAVNRGQHSCGSAAKQLGTNLTTVRRWVNLYKHHGKKGLKSGHRGYNGVFKLKVIRCMLKNHLSLMETSARFGIPQDCTVAKWLAKYQTQGIEGLLKETRGRKRSVMSKKSKKKTDSTSSGSEEKTLAALKAEVEYLRAENAFLKKLDALIQEEEAAKTQGKQQKPSGN